MNQESLYIESLSYSLTVKQWVLSIVLLLDLVVFTVIIHYYQTGVIPNKDFDKESLIAITVIAAIVSITIIFLIYVSGYTITIDEKGLTAKQKIGKAITFTKNSIKEYRRINTKEYYKIIGGIHNKKKKRINNTKQYLISKPNYLITLNSGEKILIQIKRHSAFEYSMNKMLDIKYG